MAKDLMESLSGVRGIYGNGITEALARQYVFAYCKLFENKLSKIIIAGDSRPSTPSLKKATAQAFIDCGVEQVINVGIVPIQVAEHAVQTFQAQGGLYISASHNEPEYNGFKFLKNDGAILYPEQSGELIKLAHNQGKVDAVDNTDASDIKDMSKQAIDVYIDFVLKRLGEQVVKNIKKSKFKVLADPNGGSAVTILNKFFVKLGVKAKLINNKLGEFNRLVEPKPESLAPLTEEIKDSQFAFACGFDCDADRVELVIDPNSAFAKEMEPMLDGNYVLALACDVYLEGTDGQVVVTNTVTSPLVRDVVKKHKATVKEAVKETADKDLKIVADSIKSGENTYFARQNLIIRQTCIKSASWAVAGTVKPTEKCEWHAVAGCITDIAELLYAWVTESDYKLPEPPEEP